MQKADSLMEKSRNEKLDYHSNGEIVYGKFHPFFYYSIVEKDIGDGTEERFKRMLNLHPYLTEKEWLGRLQTMHTNKWAHAVAEFRVATKDEYVKFQQKREMAEINSKLSFIPANIKR